MSSSSAAARRKEEDSNVIAVNAGEKANAPEDSSLTLEGKGIEPLSIAPSASELVKSLSASTDSELDALIELQGGQQGGAILADQLVSNMIMTTLKCTFLR